MFAGKSCGRSPIVLPLPALHNTTLQSLIFLVILPMVFRSWLRITGIGWFLMWSATLWATALSQPLYALYYCAKLSDYISMPGISYVSTQTIAMTSLRRTYYSWWTYESIRLWHRCKVKNNSMYPYVTLVHLSPCLQTFLARLSIMRCIQWYNWHALANWDRRWGLQYLLCSVLPRLCHRTLNKRMNWFSIGVN